MRTRQATLFVLGLALLSGCEEWRTKTRSSAKVDDLEATCKSAGAAYGRDLGAELAKRSVKKDAISLVEEAVVNACETDKWPESVLTCLATARSANERDVCVTSLPPNHQKRMEEDAVAKTR